MLRIRCSIDILWLIVLLANHIPLNPILVFPFPRLVGFILSIDLIEPPGVFTGGVLKAAAFDPAIKAAANYSLEVSLIAIKHLVPRVVLPQDLFRSSKDYSCGSLRGKYQVLGPGFGIRIPADLVYFLAGYILVLVRLSI
jgi:hypothetical protein